MNSTINGIDCNPLGIRDVKIKESVKEGEIFKEKTFDGDLTFYGSDYDYLISLDEFEKVELKIYQDYLIITAYFDRSDCTINIYKKTLKVKPKIKNDYEKILKNYDIEYNMYSDFFAINKYPRTINKSNLTTKIVEIPLKDSTFRFLGFKNTSDHPIDVNDFQYYGHKYYFEYDGANAVIRNMPVDLKLSGNDIGYTLHSLEFIVTATETIDSVLIQSTGNATFSKRYSGYFKATYKRLETFTYDVDGSPVSPDSAIWQNTNIVDGSGLRKWAKNPYVDYTLVIVSYYAFSTFVLNIAGYTLISDTIQLKNNLYLNSLISKLLKRIDNNYILSSNIFSSADLSIPYAEYITQLNNAGLGSYVNNLTDNIVNKLYINTVSNCMNPDYTEPDANENITLKKILDLLKDMFNIYWRLDGNFFILEHYSYFKNAETQTKDIKLEQDIEITNSNELDKIIYKYSSNYFNLFSQNEINNDLTVIKDNEETKAININVDFGSMFNKSKNISEDGFTFIVFDSFNDVFSQNKRLSLFELIPTYHLINQTRPLIKSKHYDNGSILNCEYNTVSILKKYKLKSFTDNQLYTYIDINKDIHTDFGDCEILESEYNLGLEKYNLILNINDLNL